MPYITKRRQDELEVQLPTTAGDLTYLVTMHAVNGRSGELLKALVNRVIDQYLEGREARFEDFATVIGCLTCAERELLRRRPESARAAWQAQILRDCSTDFYAARVAPYEDQKITENGDIFP